VADWRPVHDSAAFRLTPRLVATAAANGLAFWRHERLGLPVRDGVDEVSLALAADATSRTWRSRAVAATPVPVTTRFGLRILPPAAGEVASELPATLASTSPPARVLDDTLALVRQRYGNATADFVALQLEYPQPETN
jgi:hypothetical protein